MWTGHSGWLDVAICDLPGCFDNQCAPKLRVLLHSMLRNPDKVELDDDAAAPPHQPEAHAFVDDAEVARNERQGVAEIPRGSCDVEHQPLLPLDRLPPEVNSSRP